MARKSTPSKSTGTAKPKAGITSKARITPKSGITKVKSLKGEPNTAPNQKAKVLKSEVVYTGPLFRVTKDSIVEPDGARSVRDVVRHNGSVVVLAMDNSKNKKDPWIVMERQYRHAANGFLWELPAGKLEPGEDPLAGAQRELEEETGYRAKKWKPLAEFFASPGFLGESMKVFLAEGLTPGQTNFDEDENIELRLVKLSDVLKLIYSGEVQDGKTMAIVLYYTQRKKRKKV